MRVVIDGVLVLLMVSITAVVMVHGQATAAPSSDLRCPGYANTHPVNRLSPVFNRSTRTGKLYSAGVGSDAFWIQHVYGSYYDMGLAQGELHKDVIGIGLNCFYDWIESQAEQAVPWLPAWIAGLIADFGAPFALELTWNNTKPFTPGKYTDEMRGVADGAGIPAQHIFNINMIAELIKAQCSIIGANGKATMASLNGTLVHLRTLDGMGGATMPIKDYAVVTVYHPAAHLNEPVTANFGWVSFVGTVTGFAQHLGLGEKHWGPPEQDMSVHGEAWTFLTRDVLTAKTYEEALSILKNANRTCGVHLGVGSHATNQFTIVNVDHATYELINDTSIAPYPQHPVFQDIVYLDKHSQPTPSYCFPDLFERHYGNFTAELLATQFAGWARTGDLHAAVFDYAHRKAFFSNARKSYETQGSLYAYHRQFTELDMDALFKEAL